MFIPPGHTEQSVLAAMERVVGILSPQFVFGYHALDDLKQQGRLYCLQALAKGRFDAARPLENFLYTHVRNQFLNLHRDKVRRTDAPCRACHTGQPCGPHGQQCWVYRKWSDRQACKANLMRPIDIGNIADNDPGFATTPSTVTDDAEFKELNALIDIHLAVELRSDYLKLLDGQTLTPLRRERVQRAVADILADPGREPPTACVSPDLDGVDDWADDEDMDDESFDAAA